MKLRFRVAANTGAQLVGRGVGTGITLLITILLARHFGAQAYGESIKITTFVAFFYLFADFGLNAITVKELGKKSVRAHQDGPLKTLFTTRFALSILLIWLAAGLTIFLPYSETTREGFSRLTKLGIIIFAPTILFQAIIRSTNAWFQYKLRYDKAAIAQILGSLAGLALVFLFVYLNISSILAPIVAILLTYFLTAFVAYYLFKQHSHFSLFVRDTSSKASSQTETDFSLLTSYLLLPKVLSLLKKSLPLGITLILNIAFFRLDILLLSIYRPSEEVGIYGLAYKFFEFPLIVPTFFMNTIYPTLAGFKNLKSEFGNNNYSAIVKKAAIMLGAGSVILSAIFYLLAPKIALISPEFDEAVGLFRVLTLWLPLFFLSSLFMWMLIARGRNWKLAKIYATGLGLNAFLNFALIPSYGATAAAYTTGLTELLILSLLWVASRKL